MDNLTLFASISVVVSTISIIIGAFVSSSWEAKIAIKSMDAISQQPDKLDDIQKTLFMSMAMVESGSIYCLVVTMILIFANPFWNALLNR